MEDSGIDSGDHNGDTTPKPAGSESSSAASSRSPSRSSMSARQPPPGGGRRPTRPRLEPHGGAGGPSGGGAKPSLIPIQRLPVPGARDSQPLVQWDTDDSEEEIVNFFPMSRKESRMHQELTDTFSIEEMSISGDEDDEDDLHLVPPQAMYKKYGCCPCTSCVVM